MRHEAHGANAKATVTFSAETYRRLAEENAFRQETLEKVVRLGQVLAAVSASLELGPRLALKGGTVINLMKDPIRRLSVDIDFNYVGAVDREVMLRDKPVVLESFRTLASRFDYTITVPRDAHGGSRFALRYRNSLGTQDQVEIDVNWITRVPLGPLQQRALWQPEGLERPTVRMVCTEELVAGKLRALVDRVAARDVFDAAFLPELLPGIWPSREARALFVLYSGTLDLPLTSYSVARLDRLSDSDYRNKLLPVLSLDKPPSREALIARAQQVLEPMLKLEQHEIEYVDRLQRGEYRPELVLPFDLGLAESLRHHPALLWKAQNAKAHHARKADRR